MEKISTIDDLIKFLSSIKEINISSIDKKSSKRLILFTKNSDRKKCFFDIIEKFKHEFPKQKIFHEDNISSSIGCLNIDNNFRILCKSLVKESSVHYEITEINSINEQLNKIKTKDCTDYVLISPRNKKNEIYEIVCCEKTNGTPKSDFHLIDKNRKEVVWISHKAGINERGFQQWSGLTEQNIIDDPEVKQFTKIVQKIYNNEMPHATTAMMLIENENLKCKAVYGRDYRKDSIAFGRNNVTLVLQGKVSIVSAGFTKQDKEIQIPVYTLKASTCTHYNGDKLTGNYEPVLMIMYKGDRSNLNIKGARVGILPINSRKVNVDLTSFKNIKL